MSATKPALPEPVALYKKLRDIGSALRDVIPALPIETANAVMDQLNRLDDAANEISTAIAAAVSEARAVPEGCACRWDAGDKRVQTCERHQGWLDVIAEWADRARAAEAMLAATPSPAEQPKPAVLEALAELEDAINCEGFGCACAPDFKCATCRTRDTLDKAVRKPFEQLRAALSGGCACLRNRRRARAPTGCANDRHSLRR